MSVIDWLLDSDPSIRWQVMRDLQDRPESQWRPAPLVGRLIRQMHHRGSNLTG